ncbi:hypothetical protein [Derxia gummosa]|uniref:Diguanylate cyclase n=1 Tax=Derxia gummosa DSM 723 TaxID=1121388 RepID=A0A8B6X2I5_9BURK|nr:hypothetical protein [Derxia gummosa]
MPADPSHLILLYVLMPLWFSAGIADWLCHRASDIEHTAGAKESLIHLLMFGEVGAALVAGLLLDINALVIVFAFAMFFVHEATALWDVSYAVTRRRVSPFEQHVHSFLEMIPLMAALTIAALHWPQALAALGLGDEPARWEIARKPDPLPAAYVVTVLGAAFLIEFLPFVAELRRGLRAAGGRLVPDRHR